MRASQSSPVVLRKYVLRRYKVENVLSAVVVGTGKVTYILNSFLILGKKIFITFQ